MTQENSTIPVASLTIFDRPSAKTTGATFELSAEQITAREAFIKALSADIQENIGNLGGFITPGNDAEKGTIMVALSLPMPGLTFVNPDGETETTRPYNLNINAVVPATKAPKEGAVQPKALTWSEMKANQAKLKAAKKS